MSPVRRREYLQAMGIDVWMPRLAAVAADNPNLIPALAETADTMQKLEFAAVAGALAERIVVGPGTGSTLLLCGRSEEAATAIAADIARSLESEPVWGWPAPSPSSPGIELALAIEEHLFTRVLVFGQKLVAHNGNGKAGIAGSAHLLWTDPIPVLEESGEARRRLWRELSVSQWFAE